MGLTVYAENMGLFHKGSGGQGVAPLDVCLTPPPPPAGPIPVPYVNVLSASDLSKGSKTVKVDGEPTALEADSEVSTSTGDEPGTQGGGVVTHKTKGKGSFKLWSFTVKVEGKGVCRHGDMMIQNTASDPPNCVDAAALTKFRAKLGKNLDKPCPPYDRDTQSPPINAAQDKKVHGKTCWECARQMRAGDTPLTKGGKFLSTEKEYKTRGGGGFVNRDREAMTPDHQPPLNVGWALGGCHLPKPHPASPPPSGFEKHFGSPAAVKPHCRNHSNSQGSQATAYANRIINRRS